jgi:hypothetical protein
MTIEDKAPGKRNAAAARAERLAAALKANLKKRKEQARARAGTKQGAAPNRGDSDSD